RQGTTHRAIKKAAGEVQSPQRPRPSTIHSSGGSYHDGSTDRKTVPGHHRPYSRTARSGHGALAATVGARDGAAAQPLQPAALSRHQRLAVDGNGLLLPVLGNVQPGENGW